MRRLLRNIRFYILISSFALSIIENLLVKLLVPGMALQNIRIAQVFALTSVAYLYLALFISPFYHSFSNFKFKSQIIKARRGLGVSAFYFGLLHGSFEFFLQLGGFEGLGFLSDKFLLAISLSFTALVILSFMAATSFDFMIRKLGYVRWKMLHRFVYLAGILILIHALMLGTHFANLSDTIPTIFFFAFALLLLLEAQRFDGYLTKKGFTLPRVSLLFVVIALLLSSTFFSYVIPAGSGGAQSFGIHALHIQLAKQAQQNVQTSNKLPNFPGLRGDKNLRFTVSFDHEDNLKPDQDATLNFQVFNASSGNNVQYFEKIYEKVVHLIIVDSELNYFTHIHPTQDSNGFTISTQFPHPGQYHIYLDFQPLGAIEQQFAFTLQVGDFDKPVFSEAKPDKNLEKTFGQYKVHLAYPVPLKATDMSIGQQTLKFTLFDASTKKPVNTLKPYLAAYGHLVMINTKTFDYLHVHPTNLTSPLPDANGGPDVEFLPLGLYGPIKPGIYRVFGQFNPNGTLMVADYTIEVK